MNIKHCLTMLFTLSFCLASCDNSSKFESGKKETQINRENTDSLELTELVRKVYEWHKTKPLEDFPYKFRSQTDSIFTGIDWGKYNKNIEVFRKTGFFTNTFLMNHNAIALTIDSSMKKADITWRNIHDGIPIWSTEADDWCVCQDYPDNYWDSNLITIDSLNLQNNTANFYWTWDKEPSPDQHKVRVSAEKTGNKWRINSLEGFKYYGTVAD